MSDQQGKQWVTIAVVGFVIFGIAAFIYAIFDKFSEQEYFVEDYKGMTGAARTNPLLALQRLLEKRDIPVETIDNIDRFQLPSTRDVIISQTSSHYLTEAKRQQLLRWVRQGGHLIIKSNDRADDVFLALFATKQTASLPMPVTFTTHGTEALTGQMETRRYINTDDLPYGMDYWPLKRNSKSAVALDGAWGRGHLTIVTSLSFWHSKYIADQQNLSIALKLLEQHNRGKVWIQAQSTMPSLWQLLYTYCWPILLALAVLLVLYLWSRSLRLGPIHTEQRQHRHSLLEHLTAAAKFTWRAGNRHQLLVATLQDTLQATRRSHPDTEHLSDDGVINWWQTILAVDTHLLAIIDDTDTKLTEQTFTAVMQTLQGIRNKL